MADPVTRIDQLIQEVEELSISKPQAHGGDSAWRPFVPPGHCAYTWNVPEPTVVDDEAKNAPVEIALDEKKPEKSTEQQPKKEQQQGGGDNKKQQKGKKSKGGGGGGGKKSAVSDQPIFSRLDIRVGKIVSVELHPDADSMYLEKIDVGEDQPRQIVSGLVKFIPIEEMQDSLLLVVANLKPIKLRGIESFGMVLAGSNAEHTHVELVRPPPNSVPGDRIILEGEDWSTFAPDVQVHAAPKKKNSPWNVCKPDLRTDADFAACYQGKRMVTSSTGSPCLVQSLKDVPLS